MQKEEHAILENSGFFQVSFSEKKKKIHFLKIFHPLSFE